VAKRAESGTTKQNVQIEENGKLRKHLHQFKGTPTSCESMLASQHKSSQLMVYFIIIYANNTQRTKEIIDQQKR